MCVPSIGVTAVPTFALIRDGSTPGPLGSASNAPAARSPRIPRTTTMPTTSAPNHGNDLALPRPCCFRRSLRRSARRIARVFIEKVYATYTWSMPDVRVRFAPSPTGELHIGSVRTTLFNYLFARQQKGKLVLRIEDTDQERLVPTAIDSLYDGLKWLGMRWDEGPREGGPF